MSDRRPRVVLVTEELRQTGGQERAALEIARRLPAASWEVHVVTAEVGLERPLEGVVVHPVRRRARPQAARFTSFVRAASRQAEALRPAVVHGIGANCPVADVVHVQTVNREKYRLLPELRPRGALRRLGFELYLRAVDRAEARALGRRGPLLVAVSRRVGDEAVRHFGADPGAIRVVPNGVDLGTFRPPDDAERRAARRALGVPEDASVISFVGPDHRRKGLATLLAAMTAGELGAAHLVSVGGPAASLESHRRRARELGIDGRVHLHGHSCAVREAYWAGDVFAFPTLYDPFGMAPAEAMACGLPAVLSPLAGIVEFLAAGSARCLGDPRDPAELAAALGGLLRDRAAAARLGEAGREAVAQFTWARVVPQIEAVYRELVTG